MRGYVSGTILVLLGLLFLGQNFGLISLQSVWKFWPVILVVVGLGMLFGGRRRG